MPDVIKRPAKRHQMPCAGCSASDRDCMALKAGKACCVKCANTSGLSHSRQSVNGAWVPITL